MADADSKIKASEEQVKAQQQDAAGQQAREAKLVEEANMLRRAVQVSTVCHTADVCTLLLLRLLHDFQTCASLGLGSKQFFT